MPLVNTSSAHRRNVRRSHQSERDDEHSELKHKIRSAWEVHPCIVHHDIPARKQSRRGSDCTYETEPETEPENDVSDSEYSLVCQDHRDLFTAIHARRHHHPLKPSEGNVDILPMPPQSDDSVGDVIESEASSTACSEQLEEERDSVDVHSSESNSSFTWFRINYVLVMSAIMLADGLQGTRCLSAICDPLMQLFSNLTSSSFTFTCRRHTSLCSL